MRLILIFLMVILPGLIGASGLTFAQDVEVLSPALSFNLHEDLEESSGLIYWEESLWSHNDSKDNTLYRIDLSNGDIIDEIELQGAVNTDWEDIAQDGEFIYIGDIGNNSGSRKDLHILRISKKSLLKGIPDFEIISFSFEDQEDFTPRPQATDFDCEAMVVHDDQIFLFTKEWISGGTSEYALPNSPGKHLARKVRSYPVEGLITGADVSYDGNSLILCGYSTLIQPFLYILEDESSKALKRIPLALPYNQVEGVAIKSKNEVYISNEYFRAGSLITVPQKLHLLKLR